MENEKILDGYNIDNYDITALICKLAGIKDNKYITDIDEVIYQLLAHAQNPYNKDYWRTFYNALILITDKYMNNLECITGF